MSDDLRETMSLLADRADPSGAPPAPDELWARGAAYRRRRRAVGAAGVAAVLVLLAALGGLAWDRGRAEVQPAGAVDPGVGGGLRLPDTFFTPNDWLPAAEAPTGPLVATVPWSDAGWLGSRPGLVGVSATGEYAFLPLVDAARGDLTTALSADGRWLAWWTSGGAITGAPVDPAASGTDAPVTGLAVMDTTTGEVQRREVVSEHGLQPEGLAWAGDTLWWSTFAFTDVGSAAGSTSSFLRAAAWDLSNGTSISLGVADRPAYVPGMGAADSGSLVATAGRRVVRFPGPGAREVLRGDRQLLGAAFASSEGRTVVTTAYARGTGRFADRPTEPVLATPATDGRLTVRPLRVEGYAPETLTPVGWRDATHVVLAASDLETAFVSVDVATGEAEVVSRAELQVASAQVSFAQGVWSAPERDVVAPPDPFDPRAVAALGVVVVLLGAAGVGLWRRRVRP